MSNNLEATKQKRHLSIDRFRRLGDAAVSRSVGLSRRDAARELRQLANDEEVGFGQVRAARQYVTAIDLAEQNLLMRLGDDREFQLSKDHLYTLASLHDPSSRKEWTRAAVKNKWSARKLRREIQNAIGTGSRGGRLPREINTWADAMEELAHIQRRWAHLRLGLHHARIWEEGILELPERPKLRLRVDPSVQKHCDKISVSLSRLAAEIEIGGYDRPLPRQRKRSADPNGRTHL